MKIQKKYFAKWLPVEGNPKDGDLAWNDSDNIVWTYNKEHYFANQSNRFAKLFLCSRDIQVGDEFIDYHGIKTVRGKEHAPSWLEGIDAYKIIGEISPNAVWVKEGNEFDEDEILLVYRGIDDNRLIPASWIEKMLKYDSEKAKLYRKEYQILNSSCKHFH